MGAFLIKQRELCELWSWSSKIASRPNMASVANYSQLLESGWINYIGWWRLGHQQVSWWKKLIAKCRLGRAGAKWRNARNVVNCFVLICSPIPRVIHKQKEVFIEQCGFFWEILCDMMSPACDGMLAGFLRLTGLAFLLSIPQMSYIRAQRTGIFCGLRWHKMRNVGIRNSIMFGEIARKIVNYVDSDNLIIMSQFLIETMYRYMQFF